MAGARSCPRAAAHPEGAGLGPALPRTRKRLLAAVHADCSDTACAQGSHDSGDHAEMGRSTVQSDEGRRTERRALGAGHRVSGIFKNNRVGGSGLVAGGRGDLRSDFLLPMSVLSFYCLVAETANSLFF